MTTLPSTVQERITLPHTARGRTGDGSTPLTAADVFAMLRRRLVLILGMFVLFSAVAVGGFVAWWLYFPGYRAECLIQCVSNLPEAGLTLEQERLRKEEYERFVQTQAVLLGSRTILEESLKNNAVRETNWYRSIRPGEHLLELTEQLSSAPVRGTNFLRVSIECRNPDDPAQIINAVVNEWKETVTRRSAEQYAADLDTAKEEEEALDAKIADEQRTLKEIAGRLPAGARQAPAGNITAQEVGQLGEQVSLLRLELSQLEQYRAYYNNPEAPPVTPEDEAIVEQDPQVAELARALFLLEQQRAADELNFGSEHKVIRELNAQIGAAEDKLRQRRIQKLLERQAAIREAANTAYENTRYALLLTQERLAKAEAALLDQDRLLFDYANLEARILQDLEYKVEISTYVGNLERVVRQRRAIDVSVAQYAHKPLERSSPSLLLLPVGIFFALVLSMGLGLSLELLDKSVRTTQDIVRHLDIAMLGAIPDTDDEEVAIERVETAVLGAPRSMVAEAFRRIRTNLQFSAPVERQRSLLVTSPRPADGKTTVACNLALAIAQGGRHVLLVDANFRRPGLGSVFTTINPQGLSNILVGEGSLESYATGTDTPLLQVLGSGPIPPNPAELLGSEQWRSFLQDAMTRYDQVIVDAPPVLLASDAPVLATAVDGVILVVRANADSRGVARRACALLADVSAHMFGAVLNAARVTRGGYFREQLRTYYDYQADSERAELPQPKTKRSSKPREPNEGPGSLGGE